jgi:hypothetical protein
MMTASLSIPPLGVCNNGSRAIPTGFYAAQTANTPRKLSDTPYNGPDTPRKPANCPRNQTFCPRNDWNWPPYNSITPRN